MKELKRFIRQLTVACGIIWMGLALTGCHTGPEFADINDLTGAPRAAGSTGGGQTTTPKPYTLPDGRTDVLFVGDVVTININFGDSEAPTQHQEAIKDDGRITLTLVGPIVAKGKSTGELQAELQTAYEKYYKHVTVTVTSKDRYYYVSGEVKNPGTKPYLGETDILKAISSAADFTDFAKRSKVKINRANGKTETIDAEKAISDPKLNVPIYPGDHIFVPRRLF